MSSSLIPYNELETLFLDVGNTLLSMDFCWICKELSSKGIICEASEFQRAEASARPAISAAIGQLKSKEDLDAFALYFRKIVERLPPAQPLEESQITQIVDELVPILRAPRATQRLWSYVLPGVREALDVFQQVGLQLIVVSNSDGTVEDALIKQGLRHYFEFVVDSHFVGFEKPDSRIFR
ncbi:MAG: HAD family hydrolase, partial [bacterium]